MADVKKSDMEALKSYDFNFENLAFEGGGVKMIAHLGVIEVLEELGVMKKIKRFAGTSGGAIVAMFASVGATSEDMFDLMDIDLRSKYVDAWFGKLSLLNNLLWKFGWNPGNGYLNYIEKKMEEITGIKQITFKQIYEKYGHELCVVCTDVSTMSIKYFHPKTTPDFQVTLAVKCSGALPGYIQPPLVSFGGDGHYLTDGGITCCFPLHVFDGWFLSMDEEDSFLNKLQKQGQHRFHDFNAKTLGCLLMSVGDRGLSREFFECRASHDPQRPDTTLARRKGPKCDEEADKFKTQQLFLQAAERFIKRLRDVHGNSNEDGDTFKLAELEATLDTLQEEDRKVLLKGRKTEDLFKDMLGEGQEISSQDLLNYMHAKGVDFLAMLEGGNMKEINTAGGFFGNVIGIMMNVTRMTHRKDNDLLRSIGISTDYIQTVDFDLELGDKRFLIQQGKVAAVDYLLKLSSKRKSGDLPNAYKDIVTKVIAQP